MTGAFSVTEVKLVYCGHGPFLMAEPRRLCRNLTITCSDGKNHCFDWFKYKYIKRTPTSDQTKKKKRQNAIKTECSMWSRLYLWGKAEKLNSVWLIFEVHCLMCSLSVAQMLWWWTCYKSWHRTEWVWKNSDIMLNLWFRLKYINNKLNACIIYRGSYWNISWGQLNFSAIAEW